DTGLCRARVAPEGPAGHGPPEPEPGGGAGVARGAAGRGRRNGAAHAGDRRRGQGSCNARRDQRRAPRRLGPLRRMTPVSHHITVPRTARYITQGEIESASEVWFV